MERCSLVLLQSSTNSRIISAAALRAWSSMGSQSEQATRRNGGGQEAGGCLGCTSAAAGEEPATAALARTEVSVRRTPRGVSRQKLDFIESKKIKQRFRDCAQNFLKQTNVHTSGPKSRVQLRALTSFSFLSDSSLARQNKSRKNVPKHKEIPHSVCSSIFMSTW